MFRKILIANRGEIALRIIRTSKALGISTAVAYSEADREGPWLEQADETVCIGPARAYLDASAVLQAAEQTECQAIHPGYGFLAENARFAARCEQQGLTFVGPTAACIRRMGDKVEARRTMSAAGLTTIPGSSGALGDSRAAREAAEEIGYPVLLKARAGGGGKGMRRAAGPRELDRAFAEASLEAGQAFGDAGLYLEKLIAGARHVEFQVLADAYGRAIHLGERECSIQRQHQKLIEEAPSPIVDAALRTRLGEQVAAAVAGFGYRSAGTVELLRDRQGRLYFMEMNTRLQVEHPVTEMLSGIDLVEQQLRIAANEPLALAQTDVRLAGHAIELRINAEDPDEGFRPDPGEIRAFEAPRDEPGVRVRWDSAIREGYRIPAHYDSLVGKLIVHAPERGAALDGAVRALENLRIEGVKTTIPLLRRILGDAAFRMGQYDVDYLAQSGLLEVR